MEERRIMAVRDGRRLPPRNSRGEFRRRRSRRDRGMGYAGDYGDVTRRGRYGDYGEDMRRGDYAGDMRGDYEGGDMRGRDYGEDMARGGRGRGRSDYGDYGMDGHYPQGQGGSTYYPIQAMGTFEGYYGMPEQSDYGMDGRGMNYRRYGGGSRMDYGYDIRGRSRGRDYGYDYCDYGDDYGDYGETLSDKELEEWNKKLLGQLDEREKQMFSKDAIMQKIKQTNKPMEGFGEKELYTTMLMLLTDYKMTLPANPDTYLRLAYDWLSDKDVAVKGAEKLAVYYDCIVEGEE